MLPNYLAEGQRGLANVALLTGLYVAIATLVHAVIVLAAALIQPWLAGPQNRRALGAVFALLLVAVAGWVIWSTRLA